MIVWTESKEVATAFVENALGAVQPSTDNFHAAEDHEPAAAAGNGSAPTRDLGAMSLWVGHAIISDLGDGKFALVLLNYHRGCIKYDPEFAQDRWRLQLAADAAHQARICAYLKHIVENGYPEDLASMSLLHAAGEGAVPVRVRGELDALRRLVQEREAVVLSLRFRGAAGRGANIGMTSERAQQLAQSTHAARERAVGKKTIKGVDDPKRVEQFSRVLAEQVDMVARCLPDPHHRYRPDVTHITGTDRMACRSRTGEAGS